MMLVQALKIITDPAGGSNLSMIRPGGGQAFGAHIAVKKMALITQQRRHLRLYYHDSLMWPIHFVE